MDTTKKVTALAASVFAVNCILAGLSYAGVGEVPEIMNDINIAMALLVVAQGGLLVMMTRMIIRLHRRCASLQKDEDPSVSDAFAEEIDQIFGSRKAVKQLVALVQKHDEAIGELLADSTLRKVQGRTDDLPPL